MNKTGNINDTSSKLFDQIIADQGLKNDAALARFLDIKPPQVSKIRHGKLQVTADIILIIYDRCDYSIEKIRVLLAR